jgi:hypothetical protein
MIYWYEIHGSRYSVESQPYSWSPKNPYDLTDEYDLEALAEFCADEYHSNHDGWENSWPLNISIAESEDGAIIATFSVEREAQPVFYATKVKT